jgi:hypothetical protein
LIDAFGFFETEEENEGPMSLTTVQEIERAIGALTAQELEEW